MLKYTKLEDSYEDIQGATRDQLESNLNILKLPINQAIAYYMHETEGIFEDNELERVATYIAVGVFIAEHNYKDKYIVNEILSSIKVLESNMYDNLLNNKDKKLIDIDIKIIKEHLNM